MRAIKLCIYSSKGGAGKTTCATNIAGVLAKNGKRVLIIDADPSSNGSQCFDLPLDTIPLTYPELMRESIPKGITSPSKHLLEQTIVPAFSESVINKNEKQEKKDARRRIFIAPARRGITKEHTLKNVEETLSDIARQSDASGSQPWEITINKKANPENIIWANTYLDKFFKPVETDFDFIIIDAPGTIAGSMYLNSICASDFVVMPVETDTFNPESIVEMTNIMQMANNIVTDRNIRFLGPFVSRFREGNLNSYYNIIRNQMQQMDLFLKQRISLRTEVSRAQGVKDLVCFTEPSGISYGQFRLLTEEILFRIKLIAQEERELNEEESYGEEDE